MSSARLAPSILARLRQLSLAVALAWEAGWRHVATLALCAGLSSVLLATRSVSHITPPPASPQTPSNLPRSQ